MYPAMMVYLLLVLIRPQDYPELMDRLAYPLQPMALLIAAGFWMLSPRKDFGAPQFLLLLGFFCVLMVSHVFNGWVGGALEQLEKFAPVVLAFVVFTHALDSRERIRRTMGLLVLCATVLAAHGIEQAQIGVGWTGVGLSQGTRIQYVGIFNDPNDLGMLFVTCIPMAFWLGSRGGAMGLRRLWWWSLAGALLYGVYLTDSRGSLLGVLAMLGVYVWQTRGLFIAGVGGLFAFAAMLALPSRLQELDASEASAHGRIESWYEGLMMFRGDPLFGIGPDMYSDVYHLTAHNSFVLVLAETGIVGFTLWIAFIGYAFRMMWVASRPVEDAFADENGPDDAPWSAAGGANRTAAPQADARLRPAPTDAALPDGTARPAPGATSGTASITTPGMALALVEIEPRHEQAEAAVERGEDDEALAAQAAEHAEGRAISLTLLLSLVGFYTTAFFLSRSYVVILYLVSALVLAHYLDLRRRDPDLPDFALGRDALLWPMLSVGAVIGLYVLVKILLVIQ